MYTVETSPCVCVFAVVAQEEHDVVVEQSDDDFEAWEDDGWASFDVRCNLVICSLMSFQCLFTGKPCLNMFAGQHCDPAVKCSSEHLNAVVLISEVFFPLLRCVLRSRRQSLCPHHKAQ